MSISKIEFDAIASKIDVAKEISKSDDVNAAGSVEKGAHIKETSLSKIEFSEKAIFTEAVEAVRGAPDIQLDRIAELKAAIAEGTYKIDSSQLAEKMLKTHLRDQ